MATKQNNRVPKAGRARHVQSQPLLLAPLYDQIGIVLYKAEPALTRFYGGKPTNSLLAMSQIILEQKSEFENLLPLNPEIWELRNEQVLLLLRLYESLDSAHKSAF